MEKVDLQAYVLCNISLNGVIGDEVARVFLYPTDFNLGKLTFYDKEKDIIGEGLVLRKDKDYTCVMCNLRRISGNLCQACPKRYALKKH